MATKACYLAATAITVATSSALIYASFAQTGASITADRREQVILDRQGFMEGIYVLFDEIEEAAENGSDVRRVRLNAEALATTLPALAYMFPDDTNPDSPGFKTNYKTYALPAIWKDRDKFQQYLQATVDAAAALVRMPDDAKIDESLAVSLSATCYACHVDFRAPIQRLFEDQAAGPPSRPSAR